MKLFLKKPWEGKGLDLDVLDRLNESLDAFDKAIEAWPANHTEERSEVWVKRGSVLLYAPGRQKESIESLDIALQLDPKSTLAWTFKGYTLKALGRYNESIEAYDSLIRLNSSSTYAWTLRAEALMAADRYDEAGIAYDGSGILGLQLSRIWAGYGRQLQPMIEPFSYINPTNPQKRLQEAGNTRLLMPGMAKAML